MHKNVNPSANSKIEITRLNGYEMLVVPPSKGSILRFLIGIFILFWLGGWFAGLTSAFDQITSGKGGMFVILWLCGWSLGGIVAIFFAYRIFRKPIPERFLLNKPNLSYDTGLPPFNVGLQMTNQREYWNTVFARRKKYEFQHSDLRTLNLRDTDSGNRLTIDIGNERLELAKFSSEVEKEWLYNYLNDMYA